MTRPAVSDQPARTTQAPRTVSVAIDVSPGDAARAAWVFESLLAPCGVRVELVALPPGDSDRPIRADLGYGTDGRVRVEYRPEAWSFGRNPPTGDPVATAFWWLARVEELLAGPEDHDEHGRFLHASSALSAHAGTGPPPAPVDAIASQLVSDLGLSLAQWPGGAPFALALSHDIDVPVRWNRAGARQCARGIRDNLKAGRIVPACREAALLSFAAVWRLRDVDPYLNMAEINRLERRFGADRRACSTHFVIAGSHDPHDPPGEAYDLARGEVIRQAVRGGEVGLHASYTASVVEGRLEREALALATQAGMPVTSQRFHYLRHVPVRDWPRLAQAGMRVDSSLGYATHPAYRSGFSHPYRAWDHDRNAPLDLVLVPLALMDCCFDERYLDVPLAEAWPQYVLPMLEHLAAHGSAVSVLWHNDRLVPRHSTPWLRMYERILQWGRDQGAYMAGVGAIAEAWRGRIGA